MKIELEKPITVERYDSFLRKVSRNTLEKLQNFIDLLEESAELTPTDFYPDVFIEKEQLSNQGLSLGDARSIIYKFAEDLNYLILPSQLHSKSGEGGVSVRLESSEDDKIPYSSNLENFKKALKNVISTKPENEQAGSILDTAEEKTIIKNARLDKQNYLLEINNGEKMISFKSRKARKGLEKETKLFNILCQLWEFRWELKGGRVLKKGDIASLDNLAKGSDSESTEAAYKQIQRLNNLFKKRGVVIEIKGENEKYRLIINKA